MGIPKETASPFLSKQIGKSLTQFAAEIVTENNHEILSTWYKGEDGADVDLYIWADKNKNIIKQQINFYGQVVEWNIVDGLKTGVYLDHESSNTTDFIKYDFNKQKINIIQAVEILQCIEEISAEIKEELVYNFEKEPTIKSMNPKDFVKKYSLYAKDLGSKGILKSIKETFLRYLLPF